MKPRALFVILTFLVADAAANEDAARRAVQTVDGGCPEGNFQPSAGGWVAHCGAKDANRFYFVTIKGAKARVFKLFDHDGVVVWDVRPQSLNLNYDDGGGRVELSWFLGDTKPTISDKIIRGAAVCPPERYRQHYNRLAANFTGPTKTIDFSTHRIWIERAFIECKGGINFVERRGGLLIPTVGKEALRVGGENGRREVLTNNGKNPAEIAFTVAAQPNALAKTMRLLLRVEDRTANPVAAGDARKGDHFEIWLAPAVPELSCDDLLKMPQTCTPPAAAAKRTRIWIGLGAGGKAVMTAEPADAAKGVAATINVDTLAVDLSASLLDSAAADLAVLYHDQTSGTTVGTANPEKGEFSIIGDAVGVDAPPPIEERVVPLR